MAVAQLLVVRPHDTTNIMKTYIDSILLHFCTFAVYAACVIMAVVSVLPDSPSWLQGIVMLLAVGAFSSMLRDEITSRLQGERADTLPATTD